MGIGMIDDMMVGFIKAVSPAYANHATCDECNDEYDFEELQETYDGEHVCDECLEKLYTWCRDDNEWVHTEDVVYLHTYEPVHYNSARYDRYVDGYVLSNNGE